MQQDPWDELTPAQLRVATLVAEGLSNKGIGERLSVSHKTVQRHLYDIFRRLNVASRAELAAKVARRLETGTAKSPLSPDSEARIGPLHPKESPFSSQTRFHKDERTEQ